MKTLGNGPYLYLLWLIPVFTIIKFFIDNWRATALEKMLMSNFERFQLRLTKYILTGVVFGVSIYFYFLAFDKKLPENYNDKFMAIIIIASMIAIVFFIFEQFLLLIDRLISVYKIEYYIVDEKNQPIQQVIKMSRKNQLLVKSSDGIEEFIDKPRTKRYLKIRRPNKNISKLYQGYLIYFVIFSILGLSIWLFGKFINTTKSLDQFIIYILLIMCGMVFTLLIANLIEFRKNKLQNNNVPNKHTM